MALEGSVRLCERRDLETVLEIEKSCFDEPYGFSTFSYLLSSDRNGFLVAERGGRVVGYAIGQIKMGMGVVVSLAVDTNHRGGGLGENLLRRVLEYFRRNHVKTVELQVDVHNSFAIKVYQKLGFKTKRTLRGYYSSGRDAYLMNKVLDQG